MPFQPESKYPSRRSYVLKLRNDAHPEALAGRLARLGRRLDARRAAERPAAAGGVQMSGR